MGETQSTETAESVPIYEELASELELPLGSGRRTA